MINISYSPSFLLSVLLIIGLLLFYSLKIIRPEVSKEEDIFLTSLGLLYSCILIIHGWRLDPILFFSQVLLVVFVLAWLGKYSIKRFTGKTLKSRQRPL